MSEIVKFANENNVFVKVANIRIYYDEHAGKAEHMKRIKEKDILPEEEIPIFDYGQSVTIGYQVKLLCALAKMTDGNVFEFGTWGGCTIHNILPYVKHKVFTLDSTHHNLKTKMADKRIQYLLGDSTKYDYTPYIGDMSFVFVDGGHDYDTVKNDTEWAFKLIEGQEKAVIVWHDYQAVNDGYDVVKLLDELSEYIPLNYIEGSSLVFYQRGLDV